MLFIYQLTVLHQENPIGFGICEDQNALVKLAPGVTQPANQLAFYKSQPANQLAVYMTQLANQLAVYIIQLDNQNIEFW